MIEWLFLSHQPQRTITTYITTLCHLIIKGREQTKQLFGYDPAFIHIPLTQVYLQQLVAQSLEFQCAIADFVGLDINLPSDKLFQNIPFLQIRIAEKDPERFAFSLPVINNSLPLQWFQWRVLPQGMLNSPTICQYFIHTAIQPVTDQFPDSIIYHYVNDILITAPS